MRTCRNLSKFIFFFCLNLIFNYFFNFSTDIDKQIEKFAELIEDMKNLPGNKFNCLIMERNFLLLNQIKNVKEQLREVSMSLSNIQICGKGLFTVILSLTVSK